MILWHKVLSFFVFIWRHANESYCALTFDFSRSNLRKMHFFFSSFLLSSYTKHFLFIHPHTFFFFYKTKASIFRYTFFSFLSQKIYFSMTVFGSMSYFSYFRHFCWWFLKMMLNCPCYAHSTQKHVFEPKNVWENWCRDVDRICQLL